MSDVLWILGAGAAVLVGVGQATVHVYRVWSRRVAVNVAAESEDYRLQLVEREAEEDVYDPCDWPEGALIPRCNKNSATATADPSPTIASRLPSRSVGGEGSSADCDIPPSPAEWQSDPAGVEETPPAGYLSPRLEKGPW